MSVDETQLEDPTWTLRKKCAECIKGPNLIKTLIVMVCIGVVVQQITVCVSKLIDIPVTTYTHFDFNKTLMYPSVTFCREPPYKFSKLREYGLYAHPRFTSTWMNFDFENTSLDDLWEDITFNEADFFVQYGLHNLMENVEITPTVGFIQGRCYTMTPKILGTHASKTLGYSVTLQHNAEDIATSTGIYPPGYHIYIHYAKEPFTEVTVYNGGMVDTLYVNVGETLEVKLKVDQYRKISRSDDPCIDDIHYSANECTTRYVWDEVVQQAGCSGPWMDVDVPYCRNYSAMRSLISLYTTTYESHSCPHCPRICGSFLYNGFVADRQRFYYWDTINREWSIAKGVAGLQTNLNIYFNSMMVSVYEERYNYDWNIFVADLGGSVGFLLGLSVIGLIRIFGKIWRVFVKPFIRCKKKSVASVTSVTTADIRNISQDYIEKCNQWNEMNMKN